MIRLTTITLWHFDAGSGRRPPHQKATFRPSQIADRRHYQIQMKTTSYSSLRRRLITGRVKRRSTCQRKASSGPGAVLLLRPTAKRGRFAFPFGREDHASHELCRHLARTPGNHCIQSGLHQASPGEIVGSAAAPAARCRKFRRGSFILHLPIASHHSITSSARASNRGGMVSPSALAVIRLMTRSNLVGCSTGKSAGFAPRKTLSTYSAPRRNIAGKFAP